MTRLISRSEFLRGVVAIAAGIPLAAQFAEAQNSQKLLKLEHPLMPVKVSSSRIIRTVVGLRPYRKSGFVLKTERVGRKLVVHNYGHGGGGVSLSWGCASMAADLIDDSPVKHAAVIGAGVIGLSTARVLQDRGWTVTIYSEKVTPNTTSNIAGAHWTPSSVYDPDSISPAFRDDYIKAANIAYRTFQLMVGTNYGVRWIDNYDLSDEDDGDDMVAYTTRNGLRNCYPNIEWIDPESTPFSAKRIQRYGTMLVEPNTYLPALLRDFLLRGGNLVVRKFDHRSEWQQLHVPVIVNCTGLGSRELLGDQELVPVRGQLTVLEPQNDINYIVLHGGLYMFPRSDGILLGGTWDEGNWSLEPDLEAQTRILDRHAKLYRANT